MVQRFEAACAPLRPDWVLSPWTDGRRWAQQVVDDLVGPGTSSPPVEAIADSEALRNGDRETPPEGGFSPGRRSRTSLRAVSDRLVGTVELAVALVMLVVVAGVLLFVGLGGWD